jgi:hypothetical protein
VQAGWYCAAAPLVVYGFHPNLNTIDHAVLIGFGLIWLRYSLRVVAIARVYRDMPEA